jgi:hypothetical protein
VALHPNYRQSLLFAAGGQQQQLIVNSRALLGTRNNVVHSGEGPIHAIRWRGPFIAWANDLGVKVRAFASDEPRSPRSALRRFTITRPQSA